MSLQDKNEEKRIWLGGGKSLLAIIAQAARENTFIRVAPIWKSPPLNAFFFLILGYKFDNLSIDWWIYFFNIP